METRATSPSAPGQASLSMMANRRNFLLAAAGTTWLAIDSALLGQEPTKKLKGVLVSGEPTPAKRPESRDSKTDNLVDLRPLRRSPSVIRNRMVLELKGTIQVRDPKPDAKSPLRTADVEAKSTLDYEEHFPVSAKAASPLATAPTSSVRYYHEAKSENVIAKNSASTELSKDLCRVVARIVDGEIVLHSPDGPLSTGELDLLQVPGNTLALTEVLPDRPVKVGETWNIPADGIARVLTLAAVHKTSVVGKIDKVEKELVSISLSGSVEGTAVSVPTAIALDGKIQVDTKQNLITWFAVGIHEKRQVSQSEPGFEVDARIRLLRKSMDAPSETSDLSVASPKENEVAGLLLVRFESILGRYQMLTDRRWKVINDNGDMAILRLIEDDRILSQCNVLQLPKLDAGEQVTLDAFQIEIRKSLEKNFDSIATAEESVTESGLRLLRVVALGRASELPVQWIYTHLSDDTGRRMSLVFTVGGELVDKLGSSDSQMVRSLRFLEKITPSEAGPTPAAPKATDPASASATGEQVTSKEKNSKSVSGSSLPQAAQSRLSSKVSQKQEPTPAKRK